MSALNFSFASKFVQNGSFPVSNLAFLDKNVTRKRSADNFPTAQNLGGERQLPGHDATVCVTFRLR